MKRFITMILFAGILILPVSAQNNFNILKSYAFFKSSLPGTIMADETGKRVTPTPITEHFLYVETRSNKKPTADTAFYYGNKIYSITAVKTGPHPVEVGIRKDHQQRIVIRPKKGNILWQLQLTEMPATSGSIKKNGSRQQIILKGKVKNSRCVIDHEVELEPDIRG